MIKNKIEDHTRAREDDKSCTVATVSDEVEERLQGNLHSG